MAIINGSAMGVFNGKLGNAVSYQLYGKNVVRSLPSKSRKNKIGTIHQHKIRSKFIQVQRFLHPVLEFIRVGFNMEGRARQMSAHNACKSYNMLNAFNEAGEMDYGKILVSYGHLTPAEKPTIARDDAGLHFSWKCESGKGRDYENDQIMILAYSASDCSSEFLLSGAKRKAQCETLDLAELSFPVHVWIAFISDDRQQISMSTYMGEIA